MEKEKTRLSWVTFALMCTILVIIGGVVIYVISTNYKTKAGGEIATQQTNQSTAIDVENLVSDAINEKKEMGLCSVGDGDKLTIDIKLPKINKNTISANAINSKINTIYDDIKSYYSKNIKEGSEQLDLTHINSYIVTYKYDYVEAFNYLYIIVKEVVNNQHASGFGSNSTFIYDVKNDKEIKLSELLSSKGITEEKIVEAVKNTKEFSESVTPDMSADMIQGLTDSVKNLEYVSLVEMSSNKITLLVNIGMAYYEVTFNI